METIKLNNIKMFGSSSEKTEEESTQLSIFNEAEEIANIRKPEPELEEVKSHYRKKRTKDIMTQKYLMDIPLYRQENDFKRRDILLSRQTMANWIMKSSEMWLKPVCDELHKKLVGCTTAHTDETTVQVLKEPGKKLQSKSYMWLYRTGQYEKDQIALYDYQSGRSAKYVQEFLNI